MANLNDMLKDMKLHKSFYIRGVVNSLLPEFANPLDSNITEKNISGEALELLRSIAQEAHPDLQEGQVVQMITTGKDYELDNSLGSYGLTKKDGKYVVFDTYDFSPFQNISFLDAVKMSAEDKNPFMVARYLGGKLMPENSDGTSREDAMRIRIEIPDEADLIDTDFDDDIPSGAKSFSFRGPMTNKRKQAWDAYSNQVAGGFIENFFDTLKAPVEYLDNNLQRRGNTYTPTGDTNQKRYDKQQKDKGGIGKRMETLFEQVGGFG